jgi:hypothetical protein
MLMASEADINRQLLKNKLLKTSNSFNWTDLTYEDVVNRINDKLSSDPKFDNFRESELAPTMLELFAGVADLINHFIERRAEETGFSTSKLKSSKILNARNLSYDIIRPIPGYCRIKLILSGNLDSTIHTAGDLIQIPQYTKFNGENKDFILKKTFTYTIQESDLDQGSDFEKEITANEVSGEFEDDTITLIQGTLKYVKIPGADNTQVNQTFQVYRISDKTFSNIYGSEDYDGNVTKVGIGESPGIAFENSNSFTIDRRSLLKAELIEGYDFNAEINQPEKVCVIRTSEDEGVEVLFGDDTYASKGIKTSTEDLWVQYLATLGSKGNQTGIIGNDVTISDTVTTSRGVDVTSNITYKFTSNVVNGADIQSNESIENSAPAIYYSLDRVTTKGDYIAFLKSLTSPIDIVNAVVWGEQEEVDALTTSAADGNEDATAIKKLFNVVLFSCIGSMYNISDSLTEFTPVDDYNSIVLDEDYTDSQLPSQNYMTILAEQEVVKQVKYQLDANTDFDEDDRYQTIIGEATTKDWISFVVQDTPLNIGITFAGVDDQLELDPIYPSSYVGYEALATEIGSQLDSLTGDTFPGFTSADTIYEDGRFKITITADNPDYVIDTVYDNSRLTSADDWFTSSAADVIGLCSGTYQNVSLVNPAFKYSEKIDIVLSKLNDRSQLTVKNVYVSPIIQDFNINGNIYVSKLVDKDALHTNIKNTVYSYLDDNADFNKEIYKSKLVELIEGFPDVLRTDIKIEPKTFPLELGRTSHLNVSDLVNHVHPLLTSWVGNDIISDFFIYSIDQYMTDKAVVPATETKYLDTNNKYVYPGLTSTSGWQVVSDNKYWSGDITERSFYYEFVKNTIALMKGASSSIGTKDGLEFYEHPDFYSLINDVHKDLLYIIKYNMLDTNNNIAIEYNTVTVNNQVIKEKYKGGYTLGNEIVQLIMNTSVIYGD